MRNHMRVVWGLFALLVALLIAGPVLADDTSLGKAEFSWGTTEIFSDDCTSVEVLKMLPPAMRPQYKRAVTVYAGKTYEACWAPIPESLMKDSYFVIDEAGDGGSVPKSKFKSGTEV